MPETPETEVELSTVASTIDLRNAVIETLVANQHRVTRTVRRWAIAGFLVLALGVGLCLYGVHLIRVTQNQHSPIVTCQTRAVDGLLKDVPLAFAGDKNPADYSKIPATCGTS